LVNTIKSLQKTVPDAKAQWIHYTDTFGGGTRDPSKHEIDFLQSFLRSHEAGELAGETEEAVQKDNMALANLTKMMQRSNSTFKEVWGQFCEKFGDGLRDPTKHSAEYHVQFYISMAEQANKVNMQNKFQSMSMPMHQPIQPPAGAPTRAAYLPPQKSKMIRPTLSIASAPPAKRMRGNDHFSYGTAPVADARTSMLIESVKAFQKQDAVCKEMWGNYADTYLGGTRDPARHDAETLQEFLTANGVPIVGNPSAPMARGFGRKPFGSPSGNSTDPTKATLVEAIKNFQKLGSEQKEIWWAFAGNTRDPARHNVEKLQEFVATQGL